MTDPLVEYFISETNKKFEEVRDELHKLNDQQAQFSEFKTTILADSRWVSIMISILIGAISTLAHLAIAYGRSKYGG